MAARAAYDGAKRRKGNKAHMAVDTLGHLLALHVTAADEQDRANMGRLAAAVQEVPGSSVELAFVDQGYTGEAAAAAGHGMRLEVVKLPEAKPGVRPATEAWGGRAGASAGWPGTTRGSPPTLAGLHYVAYACVILSRLMRGLVCSSYTL